MEPAYDSRTQENLALGPAPCKAGNSSMEQFVIQAAMRMNWSLTDRFNVLVLGRRHPLFAKATTTRPSAYTRTLRTCTLELKG